MGKCSQRTKKVVKAIAAELSPAGIKLIGSIVGALETTNLDNVAKRRAAYETVKAAFATFKIEAGENAIRAGIEAAVAALKQGVEALAELGEATPADIDGDGIPDPVKA